MSNSKILKIASDYYLRQQGEGVPSIDASGVTATKVQVRNASGDLLAEYDKNAPFLKHGFTQPIDVAPLLVFAGGLLIITFAAVTLNKTPSSVSQDSALPNTNGNSNPAFEQGESGASLDVDTVQRPVTEQMSVKVTNSQYGSLCRALTNQEFQSKYLNNGWIVSNSTPYTSIIEVSNTTEDCSGAVYIIRR